MISKLLQQLFPSSRLRRVIPFTADLRDALDSDLPALAALLQSEVRNGHFTGPNSPEELAAYIGDLHASMAAMTRRESVTATVHTITADNVPVGYYVLRGTADPRMVEMNVLLIDPAWRKRGLASYTIQTVRSSLTDIGYRLQARCRPASTDMVRLLQTLEFVEVPSSEGNLRTFLSKV